MSINIKYESMPIVRLNKDVELTTEMIVHLINRWTTQITRYEQLQDYYMGNHDILERTFADTTKPNNQLVNNFASYIVDVKTGYFTGIPITYTCKDQNYLAKLNEVFDINNESDVTSELDKISNVKGHAYELLWIDEDGNIRFKQVSPDEIIMIYSSDIDEKPLYAIRYYNEYDVLNEYTFKRRIFLYSADEVVEYLQDMAVTGTNMEEIDRYTHYFGQVPVLEYTNNYERTGSFEDVVSLIDAYNLAQSDSVNEIQYFNDAYLMLKNMSGTEDSDVSKMKEDRILLVEDDGDAKFLTKGVEDAYLENIKDRLAKDIHKFSKTPNLVSDEFISNLSGTAIRYKVWGLEQDTAKKERKWTQILSKRIAMITKILNTKGSTNFDPKTIGMDFNRNLPQNVMELGQMVSQLRGSVSNETLLAQLPFIDNVTEEMDRLKAEKEVETIDTYKMTLASGKTPVDPNKPDTTTK